MLDKKSYRSIVREKERIQLRREQQYIIKMPYFDSSKANLLRDLHLNLTMATLLNGDLVFDQGMPS